jgi:hypothetical protein
MYKAKLNFAFLLAGLFASHGVHVHRRNLSLLFITIHQAHILCCGMFVGLLLPWCFRFSLCQWNVWFLQLGLSVTCLYDLQSTSRECIRCTPCVSTRTERWFPTAQLLQRPPDLPVTLKTEAIRSPQNFGSYIYYAVQNPPESTILCRHTVRKPSWLSELHTICL